jgi:ATP-dependent DNA helicase RecG
MSLPLDINKLLAGPEGQYLERKSLFEGAPGKKKARKRAEVRDDVAEVVASFANADGGVLILGVEDDGTVTGHNYPNDTLHHLLNVPVQRLSPPQLPGFRVDHPHGELLAFDVQMAAEPVMVQGNGYPVRVVDSVQRMPADKIAAWKQAGLAESWEARPSQLSLDDLDVALLQTAMESANLSITEPPAYLLRRRLADMRQGQLVLRRAAELLFSREPYMIDHPNAGVKIFRVVGTERRTGATHNVEELARQEGVLSAGTRPGAGSHTWRSKQCSAARCNGIGCAGSQ